MTEERLEKVIDNIIMLLMFEVFIVANMVFIIVVLDMLGVIP